VADRLRVNKLAIKVPAWVALAVARLTEVPGHLLVPPSFAECAALLAFCDELLVLPDDKYEWRTPGGRDFAAAYLLPRAETALRQGSCRAGAAAGRRRQESARRPERILEWLARDVTARGLVGEQRRG
jgi:hypothetical protein